MFVRALNQLKVRHTQVRTMSKLLKETSFGKYPALKVRPAGVDGNLLLALGFATFAVTSIWSYQMGYIIPKTPYMFFSPVGKMELDLTPDELLRRRAEEEE